MVTHYRELKVYQLSMKSALEIFTLTKNFPTEEKYSMVDQMRRYSRSICANLAEAWRKRRYKAAFIAKLSDAEGEACETQVWLEMAVLCGYLATSKAAELDDHYDHILGQLIRMIDESERWVLKKS